MDFLDHLHALSARMSKQIINIQTEEATKTAFVMPFSGTREGAWK